MIVRKLDPAAASPVQMEGAHDVRMEILVGRADGAPTFSMRHFVVEPGGHTPHHRHNYEHEVLILEGQAEVTLGDRTERVGHGHAVFIPANVPHQFRNAGPAPMRFVCMVPTSFDCGKPTPGS